MPPKNIQQRIGLHKQGTPPYYGKQQRVNVTNPSLLASQQEMLNQEPKQPLQNPGVILPQDCTQAFGPFSGNPHVPGPAGAAFMESRRPRFSGQVGRLGVLPSPRKVFPSSYVIQNLPRTEGSTGMGAGIPRVAVRPQIPCTLVQQPPEIPMGRGTGGRGTIAGNKRTVLARIGSSELDWGQRVLNKVRIVNQAPDVVRTFSSLLLSLSRFQVMLMCHFLVVCFIEFYIYCYGNGPYWTTKYRISSDPP